MTRHAVSHAAATLTSGIAAGLLIDRARAQVPALTEKLERASEILVAILDLSYSVETVTQLLFAACLAFVWGLAFAIVHRPSHGCPLAH